MTGPHLTPEREAEIRADREAAALEGWPDYGTEAQLAVDDLLRSLEAERAAHTQTRAVLQTGATLTLQVLGSVRAVYGDENQLVRDLDQWAQEAQQTLGLATPEAETTQ